MYDELYRPQFHFSAKKGWLNDPNGLVYQDGQYHLFYQHNPFGEQWGNMTWGHATSPDLVHWTEKSPALAADDVGVKFSGTAVVDYNNTAALQDGATPTMALFYTNVNGSMFDQRLAYSNDGGRSFRYHESNPILGNQTGGGSDRDPQVFWHEDSNKWIQLLWVPGHDGNPQSFQFFGSPNLKDWTYLSETFDYYECPDFFELSVDGNPNNTKWVMYGANGEYQVGSFDGTRFSPETTVLQQDEGSNFYAAQTWHDVPSDDGRRIQVTWMQGASYPGMPFNQQMGFPAELTLRTTSDGLRMFRQPIEEIELLHHTEHTLENVNYGPGQDPLGNLTGELFHIVADIELNTADTVGFNIRGHEVRYDVNSETLSALGRTATLSPVDGRVQLELLVDRSSLELYGGEGQVSMTSGFTPSANNTSIDLFATGGNARVVDLSAFELAATWPQETATPASGLIAHWRFDEPSLAANFINGAGPEFDLANAGLVSDQPGVAGRAAHVDDAQDHAYVPNHTGINASSFTASFWFHPDSLGQSGRLLGKTHQQVESWRIEQTVDGKLSFQVHTDPDTADNVQSSVPLKQNSWNHAVASYNSDTGRLELYLNGNFAGASELVIDGKPMFDDSPLMIGLRRVGQGSIPNAARGEFDDLQFYGTPLTAGQIGFLYQNPGANIDPESFEPSTLKLVVDVETGAASIASSQSTTTELKGYSILSTTGSLNFSGWQSLASSSDPSYDGWDMAQPTGTSLNELNPLGSLTVGTATSVELGNPIAALGPIPFGTRATNLDVSFQYTTADGQVINGTVELANAHSINNLLLEVDPATGQAVMTNSSAYSIRIGGYTISSESGSLQPQDGGWLSLSDQEVDGVDEAGPTTHFLSELIPVPHESLVLRPGQSYSLGNAFKPVSEGGLEDLELEFVLSEFLALAGDYNTDGVVNLADYIVWRNTLGGNVALPNEGATPGEVTSEDYQVWKDSFGATAAVDLTLMSGVVHYTSLTSTAPPAVTSVPEPSGLLAILCGLIGIAGVKHSRSLLMRDFLMLRLGVAKPTSWK